MDISVELENSLLPDRFGKYAEGQDLFEGHPIRSFPITISDLPHQAASLALTFLDWDAIPVGGFCWIHWVACNISPETTFIPENASALELIPMVQGANSEVSPLAGSQSDPRIIHRYTGPYPPDKDHRYSLSLYALDTVLDLKEGFFLNEMIWAMEGHIIDKADCHFLSRT